MSPKNIYHFGCTEKADKTISQTTYSEPSAIIMGAEDRGISKAHMDLCDELVKIPITGPIESLNVGVATGIVLAEAHKQRLNE